jgi:hypothetical protein
MRQRFAYFSFMVDDPGRVRAVAPAHTGHWHRLRLPRYSGWPFADRSGGWSLSAAFLWFIVFGFVGFSLASWFASQRVAGAEDSVTAVVGEGVSG